MGICKQEDHWLVLNTQLQVQIFQIFSEIIFSISSTQDDLKYLRMQTYTEKTQMDPRHDAKYEFQLDWIKGFGLAPVISKCVSIKKIMHYILLKNYICTTLQDCIVKIALCFSSFFFPFKPL